MSKNSTSKKSFCPVRNSRFRQLCDESLKREKCYDDIQVSDTRWDSTFCAVNPKFLAIIVKRSLGGAFIVIPLNKVGRISAKYHPVVGGHGGPVLDIAWCPHNDNIIASGSEDCTVKVWNIPDSGLKKSLYEPIVVLGNHERKVGLVLWHPTARNVLLTAGNDKQVFIWNVGTGEVLNHLDLHPDIVYSACFNWDGSKLLTTCKDKKIRIIDPRTGKIESEAVCHEGLKATRAIFLRNGFVFTTGFSEMIKREYSLRAPDALEISIPIKGDELPTLTSSSRSMFPLHNPDTDLIFLYSKGDSVISCCEIIAEPPSVHFIQTFKIPSTQIIGIGMMPKRGCDVINGEISRLYRLDNLGFCQVIKMTVPPQSELFQDNLFTLALSNTAILTADEWMEEKNVEPPLISLRDSYQPLESKSDAKRSNILDKILLEAYNKCAIHPLSVFTFLFLFICVYFFYLSN